MVDIRPQGFAALAAGMGEEWTVNYARKIKEQDPVWVRGQSRALTAMATGEQSMLHLAYYHSCLRAKQKDVTHSIECKVIEPVPARIQEMTAINGNAQNSNAALLWVEFQVSPAGQRIIDDEEPLKSSIYVPGSELANVAQGKKLSVNNWSTFHKTDDWEKKVIQMFGFPQAQIK
jgi:ABC-type Fe3+ transport system substrate-binding protein